MLTLHPILTPSHVLSWVRIRTLAYYGPTHECLHSGRVSEASVRGIAEDWGRQVGREGMWHWRVVDGDLPVGEDEGEGGEGEGEGKGIEGRDGEGGEERGRTVGIAVWSMHNLPIPFSNSNSAAGSQAHAEKNTKQEDETPPFVPPELRLDALSSLLIPLRAAQPDIMPTSHPPYLMLNQLATHPSHQGRGVGSLLLNWGLQKADEEGLVCYLNASEAGKRMYEKRGFEVRKVIEWDRGVWGGEGVDRYWCMVREPRKGGR